MSAHPARSPFEIRGAHVLIAMLAFFGAIIAINVGFTIAALNTFPGEDAPRAYVQGVRYNEILAEKRAQAALGWRASAALQSEADGAALLVRVIDREGRGVNGLWLEGALRRPLDARLDRALSFTPAGDGLYRAALEPLAAGQWRLRASARRAQTSGAERAFDIGAHLTWPS
ncbi:MAG: FixH family protein [Hyphomonadaceae bacterium]